jgi:hypothetical protein
MEYRQTTPAQNGFDTEAQMLWAQRQQIQNTMEASGPNELLDTLLIVANVCEERTLVCSPKLSEWYMAVGGMIRSVLEVATSSTARPDASLENPELYFPDVEHMQ